MQAPARSEPGSPSASKPLMAVVFADVVGYAAMMTRDERGTHDLWMRFLRDVLRPNLAKFHGQLVKSVGDGVLAMFNLVDDALDWGVAVHRASRQIAGDPAGDGRTMTFRISVHLCEVIEDEKDIYGDGVNIAKRLQENAPPGGIMVSQAVMDAVTRPLDLEIRNLGYLNLRHIGEPVRAFDLLLDRSELHLETGEPHDLPSIAVLPFENLSGRAEDDYFAEGIVEDIIVSLSSLRELFVISRQSTLRYAQEHGRQGDIGRTFGVQYVLTGTIRRAGKRIRASMALSDGFSGKVLLSETNSFGDADLFEIQDQIVERVVARIAPHVQVAERERALRKRPENFTAYDRTLRALDLMFSLDPEEFAKARELLEEAMSLDPNFAMPVAWAARWHNLRVGQGWSPDRDVDANAAAALSARAIDLDRQNALALATYGHVRSYLFADYETALLYLERAREACPNSSLAWMLSSWTLTYLGRGEEALRYAKHALKLSPFDHYAFYLYHCIGLAFYVLRDFESAVAWGRRADAENARFTSNLRGLAAALAGAGKIEEAREVATRLMEIDPAFTVSSYRRNQRPFSDPANRAMLIDHLLTAGVPE